MQYLSWINDGVTALEESDALPDSQARLDAVIKGVTLLLSARHAMHDTKSNLYKEVSKRANVYLGVAERLKKQLAEARAAVESPSGARVEVDDGEPRAVRGRRRVPRDDLTAAIEETILHNDAGSKSWSDVAGLARAKAELEAAVVFPQRFPSLFKTLKPWSGVLLYGPPGTGKSFLASVVASITESTFFSVSASDLISKWFGQSEKLVARLFDLAIEMKPSVIFIDEIDSIGGKREEGGHESLKRVKTELMTQFTRAADEGGVLVLAATNMPWLLDPALRRRFEKRIYIPLPDAAARETLFKLHLGKPCPINAELLSSLVERTEGFSGADISLICRDALMSPVREAMTATHWRQTGDHSFIPCRASDSGAIRRTLMSFQDESTAVQIRELNNADFENGLARTKPSVSLDDLVAHDNWTKQYGSYGDDTPSAVDITNAKRRQVDAKQRAKAKSMQSALNEEGGWARILGAH